MSTITHKSYFSMLVGLISAVICLVAMGSLPALAQGQASNIQLEEIIVTAQKREQSVLEVPLSITALSQNQLEELGVSSFEDYARFVPNLSFIHRGEWNRSFQPNVRGVQQGRDSLTTAFYFGESPLQPLEFSRTGLPDPNMFDVNRVEVLKGPQGTLYGASAMGGAIKVIPNEPDSQEFAARVEGDFSQFIDGETSNEFSGMINLPLIQDELALRLVATVGNDGGYIRGVDGGIYLEGRDRNFQPTPTDPQDQVARIKNAAADNFLNDGEFTSVRAALRWQPTQNVSLTPMFMTQTTEEGHGRMIASALYEADDDELIFPVFGDTLAPVRQQLDLYNLTGEFESESVMWTGYVTLYDAEWNRTSPFAGIFDDDVPLENLISGESTAVIRGDGEENQVIMELRGSTAFDGVLNGTAGVFYRDIDRKFTQVSTGRNIAPFFGSSIVDSLDQDLTFQEIAAFGQLTARLSESFEVSAGLRWYDYDRTIDSLTAGVNGDGIPVGLSVSEDGVEYSVSASYFPNERNSLYVRAATGYRPGFGVSLQLPELCDADLIAVGISPDATSAEVLSDELENYEIGWKARLFDDRLAINVSAYFIDWSDVQFSLRLDTCSETIAQNAGSAEVMGFELEAQAQLSDQLSLTLAVGQADSELTEDSAAFNVDAGTPLTEVGEWSASGSLRYDFAIGAGNGYIRGDVSYTDESLYNFRRPGSVRVRDIKESLFLVNLSLGYEWQNWTATLYGKNVLNELERGQCRDSSFTIPGERHTCVNVPRQLGMKLGYRF